MSLRKKFLMKFSIPHKKRNSPPHSNPAERFTKKAIGASPMLKTKAAAILIFSFVAVVCFGVFFIAAYEKIYDGKIYPGVYIGQHSLSGATRDEAMKQIHSFQTRLEADGIIFTYKNKTMPMYPVVVAPGDLDLTYELFSLDPNETVKNLFAIGRSGALLENLMDQFKLFQKTANIPLSARIDDALLLQALKENFKELEIPSKNAELKISANFEVFIIPEEKGIVPDYAVGITELYSRLQNISSDQIALSSKTDIPEIFARELSSKKVELEALFATKSKITFSYNNEKWAVDKNTYKDWITLYGNNLSFTNGISEYIVKNIAQSIEREPEEARFKLTSGVRVDEFKPSIEGVKIDYGKTIALANEIFFSSSSGDDTVPIQTNIILPQYKTESINNLGIKELIGVGVSHFTGSPKNRRHNIAVGADAVNGILVAPGDEFSLVKTLGKIDGEHNYLPELVIKGDRTIPEYGGGLCQIGTTLFRAALASGLPITERKSHSYRVSYYEPAGTDCTIYPEHPDCRFVNDTGNYILIQTRVEKDDLYFEFWGTKDGRTVSQTEPKIYNITKPPPTKYIETEDIKQGETKCTERAHNGAETDFDYTVTYPDGTVKEKNFRSYYKPWQAVCLVGKKIDASAPQTVETQKPSDAPRLLVP